MSQMNGTYRTTYTLTLLCRFVRTYRYGAPKNTIIIGFHNIISTGRRAEGVGGTSGDFRPRTISSGRD
jgi:hypothetical protein